MKNHPEWQQKQITSELKEILSGLLQEADALDLEASFAELGINSLTAVELVESINERLALSLGIEVVFDYPGINELASHINGLERVGGERGSREFIGQANFGGSFTAVKERIEAIVVKLLQENQLEPNVHASFVDIGINSLLSVELVEMLSAEFGFQLGVETIFDYTGVRELAEFIHDRCAAEADLEQGLLDGKVEASAEHEETDSTPTAAEERPQDIAIVGLSGKFAGSESVAEFWEHLQAGESCIREIEREGWRVHEYYDSDPAQKNKSISKWGGFLKDVDAFDPLFFNISPLEAERMDPQQRLFLEESFKAFEDGGYAAEQLSGRKIGVFVGGRTSDYKERTLEGEEIRSQTFLGNDMAILSARISYFLNLKGPSLSIDTACSSSLVAIHLACESIRKGESEMALAGGVFALSSPEFYIMTSKTNMLSPDGKCKTFDNSADGIVIGEGVGVAVLKKLGDALADGDHIYGVIKGSAINQDGRTKGITAPSMRSQKALLEEAYLSAGISPDTVSYIEAHGTGTKLGDPIEIKALTEAFRTFTDRKRFCAIGSHKPNVGHSIMSAGIAGVFKILMAMKHRQIPPTINVGLVNEHIDFENSPFYLNTRLAEWRSDVGVPLRAGISSFGFSGTNCHVILEEPPVSHRQTDEAAAGSGWLFPLSAKTAEALDLKLDGLKNWLEHQEEGVNLEDIAYSLSVGRSHYSYRCAVVASGKQQLLEALETALSGGDGQRVWRSGQRMACDESVRNARGEQLTSELKAHTARGSAEFRSKLEALAGLYVEAYDPDWGRLFQGGSPRRIPLPTYPFSKERYWLPALGAAESPHGKANVPAAIHPLLHENTSTFMEQHYRSTFTGDEFFLADHVVKGRRVLPGVACLEMARKAVQLSSGGSGTGGGCIRIRQAVWSRPIVVEDQPIQVHMVLDLQDTGDIVYEIYSLSGQENEPFMHAQGKAAIFAGTVPAPANIETLLRQCDRGLLSAEQCYESYRTMGIDYGPGHRGVKEIHIGDGQVLARLELPSAIACTEGAFVLHPSVMDAALQASLGLRLNDGGMKLALPFALQEMEVFAPCAASMWAALRYSEGSQAGDKVEKLDIDLFDESGTLCIRMKGFSTRVLEGEVVHTVPPRQSAQTVLLYPVWQDRVAEGGRGGNAYVRRTAFFCEPNGVEQDAFVSLMPGVGCIVLRANAANLAERYESYAVSLLEHVQQMMKDKSGGRSLLQLTVTNRGEGRVFAGLAGLLKTVQAEHPNLHCQLIELEPGEAAAGIAEKLNSDSLQAEDTHIRYDNGVRRVAGWQNAGEMEHSESTPWRERGVYLITGGAGGLGRVFAREIAQKASSASLILTGRSPLDADKQALLEELRGLGAQAEYRTVDVSDRAAVEELVASILADFGGLHGILHGAGTLQDSFVVNKTGEQMHHVLAPKVAGLVHLDQASRGVPLDFFYMVSSVAGSLGNVGQADYAAANAFMDAYAVYRSGLVAEGRRSGRTFAVNWPLWKEGGMRVDAASENQLKLRWGMIPMQTSTGLRVFYQSFASGKPQVLAMEGDAQRFSERLVAPPAAAGERAEPSAAAPGIRLAGFMELELGRAVSRLMKIRLEQIRPESEFTKYGFDSITFTELANSLNQTYKLELTPTVFFEHTTIRELAGFLAREYEADLTGLLPGRAGQAAAAITAAEGEKTGEDRGQVRSRWMKPSRRPDSVPSPAAPESGQAEDMAIVGISGKFPQADNLEAFWSNLLEGKICVTEVPGERWDWREHSGSGQTPGGMRWGGFIDGVDRFDPLFFGISPREAEIMDPQQRLLLMEVWHALEDAGLSPEVLPQRSTGVFVAAGPTEYKISLQEPLAMTTVVPSMIANRISYTLNLKGPSEVFETACSSTFVALHRAIESIRRGECDQAVVGAVNLLLSPAGFIGFDAIGYLSPDGKSRSFQEGAAGYARSEGVGALIVKPLRLALADHDHIYAVVKGTGVSHGGRSLSLTAPSAVGMKAAMTQAYRSAGISPATVSYIEAHGIASPMGDGIEISALKSGYQELADMYGAQPEAEENCYVSSLKPSIGHGEVASGLSELFKVLLAMRNGIIPGIAGFTTLNGNISLKGSRLEMAGENRQWLPRYDKTGKRLPRRAGINSYGFSGVNAHTVLEEYIPVSPSISGDDEPQLIVLSGQNASRLLLSAEQLLYFVEAQETLVMADLAYTLQVGRKEMDSRLALVAGNREELLEGLRSYVSAAASGADADSDIPLYSGELSQLDTELQGLLSGKLGEAILQALLEERQYDKLALYWAKGGMFPWEWLHEGRSVQKIPLPVYPFEQRRYWYEADSAGTTKLLEKPFPAVSSVPSAGNDQGAYDIRTIIGDLLGIPPEELPAGKRLTYLGYSSIQAVTLRFKLLQTFGLEVPMAALSEQQNVEQLENSVRAWLSTSGVHTPLPDGSDVGSRNGAGGADANGQANRQALLPVLIPNPEERFAPFPLTDMQESFLTGRKLKIGGDPAGCHIYFEWESSELDVYRLGKAWEDLVAHHDMLRCVISADGQQQVLEQVPPYTLKVADLRRKGGQACSEALEQTRERMSHQVYETGQWPLFEIRVSICPDRRYIVHFSIDEFIIDASGVFMLLEQWKRLYDRRGNGLIVPEVTFRDYVAAIKAFEGSPRVLEDQAYWADKLRDMPAGPLLPMRKANEPQGTGGNFRRNRLTSQLPGDQWERLKQKADSHRVSPTAVLLGGFAEILRGWSSQSAFTLILTLMNRFPLHPQLSQVLGPFISSSLFIIEDGGGQSFIQRLLSHQEQLWASLDHSSVSGVRALRELKGKSRKSGAVHLPVVFTSLINSSARTGETSFFEQISYMVTQTPQVYLDHQVWEMDGNLMLSWDVAEGLFSEGAVRAMFGQYCALLAHLASSDEMWQASSFTAFAPLGELLEREPAVREGSSGSGGRTTELPEGLTLESAPEDRLKPFPLTEQQQAYLFGRSKYAAGGNGSCQLYQEIDAADLDVRRLERTWNRLVRVHPMLAVIIRTDGVQQQMDNPPEYDVKSADLTNTSEAAIEIALRRTRQQMLEQVFDLSVWPYFDLRVSLLPGGRARIHFSIDMLIADGYSIHLLLAQLLAGYEQPEIQPQPSSVLFRDYVLSLQAYKKTASYSKSSVYWEAKFTGLPPGPQLPLKAGSFSGGHQEHEQFHGVLPFWTTLKEHAGKRGLEPGMVLLGAFARVLAAWLEHKPFTLAIPCWDRLPLHRDIHETVGDFTAMSWVPFGVEAGRFEENVQQYGQTLSTDLSHMAARGLKALRKAAMRRGRTEGPLYPVVFTNLMAQDSFRWPERFNKLDTITKTPQVHLDHISEERSGKLYYQWDVLKGIYPEGMINEMFAGYCRVLEALASAGHGSWDELDWDGLIRVNPGVYTVQGKNDEKVVIR